MELPRGMKRGQVYIGVIIALGIFLILSQTVVSLVFSVYDLVSYTRTRTTARLLAEQKLETIKNLSYTNVGTVNGVVPGALAQTENVVQNGLTFTVSTRVDYIDDPFDGVAPSDTKPADYKKVTINVTWGGINPSNTSGVVLSTNISPDRNQDVGGGTLEILVSDSLGNPVPQTQVTIIANTITPPVNEVLDTDSDGKISLPGIQSCATCYNISATKAGFSTDKTYSTSEVTNPSKPFVTVVDDQVSQVNFTIDTLGTLAINSTHDRASSFSPLANQQFILRGEKIIGTDSNGTVIYKYAQVLTTNGTGSLTVNNLEWDTYHIIIPTGVGWDVSGTNPLQPVILNPGASVNIAFASTAGSTDRLLAVFKDQSNNPISSVAATLKDSLGYEASISSGLLGDPDYGQAFFPSLEKKTYTLIATVSGYLEYIKDVDVSDYTQENVIMVPQ